MKWERSITIADVEIHALVEISGDPPVTVSLEREGNEDALFIRLHMVAEEERPFTIENIAFSWAIPATDMHGVYFGGDPREELGHLPFWSLHKDVAAHSGLPFVSLIHRSGENRAAFGLLDQLTETRLHVELSEITRCYHMKMQKPANRDSNLQAIPVTSHWDETLFISFASQPWPEVLAAYVEQVTSAIQQPLMPVPDSAYDPVFCTWTAIHHDVSHDWVMNNAPLAADLGFRTWLTDDGWFLQHGKFGNYEEVGAWQPYEGKFPDFAAHVQAVKALGFRYVLWVAPFMIGMDSVEAEQYAHLLTKGQERERFHNLSPWHEETTAIVRDLLTRLVEEYDLDGLKIDFIDALDVHSVRRDGASDKPLGQCLYHMLQLSIDALREARPDLLVEFRNRYTNLASRSYANLYRSSDVPINFRLNRWQAVMLRLLAPDRAVHMDPMLWHPADTDENVAVHLINGIASVPMLSIELSEYPQSHLDLIRYWIGFYNEHRDTIIRSQFKPLLRPTHIPRIDFIGHGEAISMLYDDVSVPVLDAVKTQWVLNASTAARIDMCGDLSKPCRLIGRDKFGTITFSDAHPVIPDQVEIEIGGSIELQFMN